MGAYINQLGLLLAAVVAAVTLHEVAHGYVAFKLGDRTALLAGRLTLNPLNHLDIFGSVLLPLLLKLSGAPVIFGYARPVPVNYANLGHRRSAVIRVAAAGVIANMMAAVACGIVFQTLLRWALHRSSSLFGALVFDLCLLLGFSVLINSVLAIFNLLPLPPLDGGRMLTAFLPPAWRRHLRRLEPFAMLFIIVLLVTNMLGRVTTFLLTPWLHFTLGPAGIGFMFSNTGVFR